MYFKILTSLVVLFFVVLIAGCRAAAVYNVDNAPFVAPANTDLDAIRDAIVRAALKAGWRAREVSPGVLLASYSYKRNQFGAVVKITYDLDSYDINYYSSHNLKYNENIGSEDDAPDFFDDSKDFFSDTFGGDSSDIPVETEKPATIHKIYNKWVSNLERSINSALSTLSAVKYSPKPAPSPKRTTQQTASCDDQPVFNSSGQGRISRSTVNVRTGASTHCNILATVGKHDVFTLLGKKDKWYYIKLPNGNNGWIYASLVSRVGTETLPDAQSVTATSRPAPADTPPPPPPAPTRKISIAVIRFKTLNKEAQDISLGELVSETFTSALVNSRNFKIIEREQLDKVVKEMEMTQTGFIETTDAVEIGKMLHADAIITGSVALLGDQIQLNARIIEIESAYVISADTKTTSYTLKNINMIAQEIVGNLARKLSSQK